ncbi:MarR family transcriptional regulator [Marinobacter lipolyticus SM19]|uniref:MarR family transcriptional regulator n=1 Tax=Marinobacter lipolyticus SM19 TaxID=1318628 RepID=R8B3N8_9GAMM|nr:MarR family transcriptional regulator [Marinobacter lipolyticus SM19]
MASSEALYSKPLNASDFKQNVAVGPDRSSAVNNYEQVLVALRRVIRATDLHSKRLSKHAGLTGPQLLIMRTIRDLGEVTIGTIADKVSLSQATVTTILDRLEHRQLVYRVRSTRDKRKVHAHLTEGGADILARAPQPLQEDFIKKFQSLHEWEQTMIIASLQRVANMMDADDIDASPVLDVGPVLKDDGWKEKA